MSNIFGMFSKLPKSFSYRDLMIHLLGINNPSMEVTIFTATPMPGVDASDTDFLRYAEIIPRDPYFAILVAAIYNLSILKVDVRMEIDECEDAAAFYIVCKTVSSDSVFVTYQQTLPLFTRTLGRMDNVIYDVSQPFIMRGVTDAYDSLQDESAAENGTDDIHGLLRAEVCFPTNRMSMARYLQPYGATISVNVTNYAQLKKSHPYYAIIRHEKILFDQILPAVRQAEESIHNYLDPMHLMKIMYRHMFVDMNSHIPVESCVIKDVIEIASINDVEIYDLSPDWITIRPKQCDDIIRASALVDWNSCYPVLAQIATALLSDNGTLFIPEIASMDTAYHGGKWWLKLFLRPHFAYFTKERIFYGDKESISTFGDEFFWLQANITDQIQFIFPTLYPVYDPAVLCYGRVMVQFLKGATFDAFAQLLTCDEIKVRICAQVDNWVYFAVVDDTIYQNNNALFFEGRFIAEIATERSSTVSSVFDTLIGAFASADPTQILNQLSQEEYDASMKKFNGDENKVIFDAWESSVNMHSRSFAKEYYTARQRVFHAAEAAAGKDIGQQAAEESFKLQTKFKSPLRETLNTVSHTENGAPEAKRNSIGLLGRLFGRNDEA